MNEKVEFNEEIGSIIYIFHNIIHIPIRIYQTNKFSQNSSLKVAVSLHCNCRSSIYLLLIGKRNGYCC